MRHQWRPVVVAYLLACVMPATVAMLRYASADVLGNAAPAIPFTIPIVVAAWYGGLGPGLLATAVSVVLLDALFLPPRFSLAVQDVAELVVLVVFLASGVLISWLCQSLHDATRRVDVERERTTAVLESISDAFYTLDRAWRFTYVNHETERYYGRTKADLLGQVIWDAFPQKRSSEFQRRYEDAAAQRAPQHFETRSPATGRWVEVHAYPSADGLSVFFRDVTERKEAESRLRAERERVQLVADAVPALISYIDADGRYQLNNRAYEAWFGRPRAEVVGRHMRDVLGEAAWSAIGPRVERALAGEVVKYEAEAQYRDGGTRWISASYTPDVDESGRVRGIVAHVNDISAQKRSEREREQSLATFNSLVAAAPLGITLLDREMRYQFVNGPLAEMNGLSAADHVGRHVRDVVPAIHPQVEAAFRRAIEGAPTPDLVVQADTPATAGTSRLWRESWFPVPGQDGTVASVGVIVEDVTEQRRAQEELAYHRSLLQAITDNAQTGIVLVDGEGRGLFVNPAFEEITGYAAERLIGCVLHDLLHHTRPDGEPYPIHDCPLVRALQLQRTVQAQEDVFVHRDGHFYPVRWSARPVFREGRPVATVIEVWDITAAKESERRINDLVAVLREADRRKDEFLATLAHELRNPLAPVRNALEVLRRASDAQTIAQARAMMERQVGQMVHLIDDLLDVSRITSGKVRLRRERLDLSHAVQSAVDATRPLIDASGHSLAMSLPREPLWVDADATRLVQVFSNLLTNAAKYSERGGRIAVDVRRHGGDAVIAVRDSGIGIAPEHLPHLFEMFTQFAPALERSQGGLGIGLALVKGLLEMHGGTVEARSEGPGTGSEFVVRLPLVSPVIEEARTDAGERVVEAEGPAAVRVLIVDDNRDSAESLAMLLELHGHDVRTAQDGVQAVQMAAAFRPQLVLLDIGMPRMNGYEAAAHIRAQLWGRQMVLVAMTGWGQEEDKRRTAEAGFDHHLTKPVDPAVLEQLVASVSVQGG